MITSYGTLLRMPALSETTWRLVILDEAQAIKNPGAKQTRAAKALKARARIALTGTPVENSLGDLWSIFDVINPGLLGRAQQFSAYTRAAGRTGRNNPYGPLRELVRPYILRRMKTDRSVIADLPDKTEVKAHCHLSRKQAALYAQAVADLARSLEEADGIQRKGLVLAMLMRLKQICNHPSQWLNDGSWAEANSGKLARLREIAEVVAARQEKMLVFTQFREATAPLAAFLGGIFGRSGLVLHGATEVRHRQRPGAAFPGRRVGAVLRVVVEGRRRRADADGGIACRAFRSLVESGGGEPGDRPRLPHRPEEERAGAQIRLPWHDRG